MLPSSIGPRRPEARSEIFEAAGLQAHQAGGGGVDGREVRAQHQQARGDRVAHDRAVALHADDAVDDRQVGADGGVDVEDRAGDPPLVEQVLRPAVAAARHHAEEVLQGEGRARPVVRLELRQGDDPVGASQGPGQVQGRQARQVQEVRGLEDVVVVQVDEGEPVAGEDGVEPRLFEDEARVPAVALALGDQDFAGVPATEDLGGGADDRRMCVDVRRLGRRLDEVRLQEDRPATRPTRADPEGR